MFPSKSTSANQSSNPSSQQNPGRSSIKQAQEEALESLPQRKLYINMYIRDDPPAANDFHWSFYYHKTNRGGIKYHLKNLGGGWITDHGWTGGVMKSQFLCVLVQIASIAADEEQRLDRIMRTYDGSANDIADVTCRVWLVEILQHLVQEKLVECNDLQSLLAECFAFGNQYMTDAAANRQPRPVVVSTHCT